MMKQTHGSLLTQPAEVRSAHTKWIDSSPQIYWHDTPNLLAPIIRDPLSYLVFSSVFLLLEKPPMSIVFIIYRT